MVKRRAKPKGEPPKQPIPDWIQKGDCVVYMLQRIDRHHAVLVDFAVFPSSEGMKDFERHLLDFFKSSAVEMTPRLKPPGMFGRAQVKFGITKNLQQRLEAINKGLFDSGTTEWRKLPWPALLIAHRKFWWMRNRGRVMIFIFLLLIGLIGAMWLR